MRITADEVILAYEKTGLTPAQGIYLENGCGCGLSAVAMTKDPEFFNKHITHFGDKLIKLLGIDYAYMDGFIRGFDGGLPTNQFSIPNYKDGYSDGRHAWIQLQVRVLREEEA